MSVAPFHHHLDRVYCQALVAVLGDDPAAASPRTRLAELERSPVASAEMANLVARFHLTEVQRDFVWTVVALTAEPRMVPHGEALDGLAARRGVSPALFARLAPRAERDVRDLAVWLARGNPLVDAGLLIAADAATQPSATPFAPAPRLVGYLGGEARPEGGVEVLWPPGHELQHDDTQRAALAELSRIFTATVPVLVVIEGPRGSGRRTAITQACPLPAFAARAKFESVPQLEATLAALRRETTLAGAVPVLTDLSLGVEPSLLGPLRHRLEAWLRSAPAVVAITTSEWNLELELERPVFRVRWPIGQVALRRRLWPAAAAAAAVDLRGDLDALAMQYRIGPGGMARALQSAATGRPTPVVLDTSEVVQGIRHNIAERLGGLARRIDVRQRWDDLVLGEDTHDQVRALIARVRHAYLVLESWEYRRKLALGQGVAALFSGPPGTGKTMVAGLIASELGLDLYQVDLSQVVSKWVGETEKQLARIFEAAEEGHALLLFDEADALFGQRSSEMKSATDRYANLEVNYLLQRIEAFGGVVVLTTNLDASIDKALKRRLAAHIVFGPPDEEERERLWERLTVTGAAPIARDLDYGALARDFATMTGANIRNAAIAAAFLAAGDGRTSIEQDHLVRAARSEYRSMGHVLADRPMSITHS